MASIRDAIRDAGHAMDDVDIERVTGIMRNAVRAIIAKPQNRDMFLRVEGGWVLNRELRQLQMIGCNGYRVP